MVITLLQISRLIGANENELLKLDPSLYDSLSILRKTDKSAYLSSDNWYYVENIDYLKKEDTRLNAEKNFYQRASVLTFILFSLLTGISIVKVKRPDLRNFIERNRNDAELRCKSYGIIAGIGFTLFCFTCLLWYQDTLRMDRVYTTFCIIFFSLKTFFAVKAYLTSLQIQDASPVKQNAELAIIFDVILFGFVLLFLFISKYFEIAHA